MAARGGDRNLRSSERRGPGLAPELPAGATSYDFGQLTAAGVLTGELVDDDGAPVALGRRRHTAAAQLVSDATQHVVHIEPVDVSIAAFLAQERLIAVTVPRDPTGGPARQRAGTSSPRPTAARSGDPWPGTVGGLFDTAISDRMRCP